MGRIEEILPLHPTGGEMLHLFCSLGRCYLVLRHVMTTDVTEIFGQV